MHWAVSAGLFATITSALPGAQGAGKLGTQGPGVAVGLINVGLKGELHSANGATLTMGLWSMIVAMGLFSVSTLSTGNTVNVDGATPIVHVNIAPVATKFPILLSLINLYR